MDKAKTNVNPDNGLEANVRKAVDQWYADNLSNSVVSRDTSVHNLIHASKPALVKAIVAAVDQTKE